METKFKNLDTVLDNNDIIFLIDEVKSFRDMAFDNVPTNLDGSIDYQKVFETDFANINWKRYINAGEILIILYNAPGAVVSESMERNLKSIDMEDIPIITLHDLDDIVKWSYDNAVDTLSCGDGKKAININECLNDGLSYSLMAYSNSISLSTRLYNYLTTEDA